MATANLLFRNDFDGAGYPDFAVTWPYFSFPTGNPNAFTKPVVDGHGFGIANRFVPLLWRAKCDQNPGPNYCADLRAVWRNATGARRSCGLIVRFKDWDNLLVARLQSNIADSPTLKLYK